MTGCLNHVVVTTVEQRGGGDGSDSEIYHATNVCTEP